MSCVVLLPIHQTDLSDNELYAIKHNFSTLNNWDHIIISPKTIVSEIKDIFEGCSPKNIKFIGLEDEHFKSVTSYDQMLLKRWFYEMFSNYEFLLITQTDVVIFRDELNEWIKKDYDYIGAPWIIKRKSGQEKYYVGNGGISLRKVISFMKSLDKLKILRCPKWYLESKNVPNFFMSFAQYSFGFNKFVFFSKTHEDFFWSQLIPSTNYDFKVASAGESFKFAIEKFREEDISNFLTNIPFAIHAWEKHSPEKIKKFIEQKVIQNE